mgnify:CR=1 FL=1
MEFDQVLALRKSIRSYTDEPVSKEDLAALVKAALASSVGKHNDAGYTLCVVTDPALLSAIDKEAEEKLGKPHMFFEAPALIFICETKEAFDYLKEFDAGIIAEHIHLKASDLGLGSVVLYGLHHPSSGSRRRLCEGPRSSGRHLSASCCRGRSQPRGKNGAKRGSRI